MLPSDKSLYPRSSPIRAVPPLIRLDASSSCPCTSGRTLYDDTQACIERSCIVFALVEPLKTHIQLQQCNTCPVTQHRFIGPDLRAAGIFNYNNKILLTHELLDEYTSSFTTSETPFVAWVSVVTRRYANGGHDFMSEELFRSAWFSYVRIQQFDSDMQCIQCGPSPDDVIWDGVTLAFGRKHVLGSLKPPTMTEKDSPIHSNRRYIYSQQALTDRSLRDLLRKIIASPILSDLLADGGLEKGLETVVSGDGVGDRGSKGMQEGDAKSQAAAVALDHLSKVDNAGQKLTALSDGLGILFGWYYGMDAYRSQRKPPASYRRLFLQVCRLTVCLE